MLSLRLIFEPSERHTMFYIGPEEKDTLEQLEKLKYLLETILELAKELDLEERNEISVAHYVLIGTTDKTDDPHTIYHFPLTALTERVRLTVFRKEGTPYNEPAYAVIDDNDSVYEPIDIATIVEIMQHPRLIGDLPLVVNNLQLMKSLVKVTRKRLDT